LGKLQTIELESPRLPGNLAEVNGERLGLQVEIHKDKLLPGLAAERHHAHGAAVKELNAFDIGCADQAAIKRVRPAVVLATEDILAAAAQGDGSGAVAANVAKRTQLYLLLTDEEDWCTSLNCVVEIRRVKVRTVQLSLYRAHRVTAS